MHSFCRVHLCLDHMYRMFYHCGIPSGPSHLPCYQNSCKMLGSYTVKLVKYDFSKVICCLQNKHFGLHIVDRKDGRDIAIASLTLDTQP